MEIEVSVFVSVRVDVRVEFPESPGKVSVLVNTCAGIRGIEGRVKTANSNRTMSHDLDQVNVNVS